MHKTYIRYVAQPNKETFKLQVYNFTLESGHVLMLDDMRRRSQDIPELEIAGGVPSRSAIVRALIELGFKLSNGEDSP